MTATKNAPSRIRMSPKHPGYWEYRDETVLLIGGSVEDNLFQIDGLIEHLDLLEQAGGNYVRCTMSSRDDGNVWPFARTGETYDLNEWNPAYWDRFERFLQATCERDIIVQIELWATFDYYVAWAESPFNPANNRTYTEQETGLPLSVTPMPQLNQNTFFWSVPELGYQGQVLHYQCRFVDRVLESSLSYPNVLYCIDNETHAPAAWARYWASYIREAARRTGYSVEVGEMFWQKDLRHPQHRDVYRRPELFSFWEISQNNLLHGQGVLSDREEGDTHWSRLRFAVDSVCPRRPVSNVKIYGKDGQNDFGGPSHALERFWRNVIGGAASARFHRPPHGLGLGERARASIRSARLVCAEVDLFSMSPELVQFSARDPGGCYASANTRGEFLMYFPRRSPVEIQVSSADNQRCRWLNPDESRFAESATLAGPRLELLPPAEGHWVAVISPA